MCRCKSLSVFVESITVEKPTTSGSGMPERVFGGFFETDDVSFAAIAEGTRLSYPPGGRKGWPEDGSWELGKGEKAPSGSRIRVATVTPFDERGCSIELKCLVQFFEKDWDSLQSLLDQAVEQAVELGLISAPAASGFSALAKDAVNVLKDILNLITSLSSESMGDPTVFRLPTINIDNPKELAELPWGSELIRSNMSDKEQDSFRYTETLRRWGGEWTVVYFVQRRCVGASDTGDPSSGGEG